jgi:mRNA-degrading endonuclease toxin of MazEF toxin-antitoxin module
MKQFDIFYWKPSEWKDAHPAVVVSHPDRANRKPQVEVLLCTTQRAQRRAEPHEIILDEADGLDWPTLCKCDLIYAAARSELTQHKGRVTDARQGPLVRTMIAAHGWGAVL